MKIRFQLESLQEELAQLKSEVRELRTQIDDTVGGANKLASKMKESSDGQDGKKK